MKQLLLLILSTASIAFAQMPTGQLTLDNAFVTCAGGNFECTNFSTSCPNIVQNHACTGTLARWSADNPIATLLIFSGHAGTSWWNMASNTTVYPDTVPFFQSLHNAGYSIVMVRWDGSGWPFSSQRPQGFATMACRPATVIQWVHDNWAQGQFIVSGSSEGSAAVGYAMSRYGSANIIDHAILISGPPMADLADGCMEVNGYGYVVAAETFLMDEPWGYPQNVCGPCCQHDPNWISTWIENSVETGGNSYNYPQTSVDFIIGGHDEITIQNHAHKLYDVYQQNGQPNLTWNFIPTMGHTIQQFPQGLNEFYNLVTQ